MKTYMRKRLLCSVKYSFKSFFYTRNLSQQIHHDFSTNRRYIFIICFYFHISPVDDVWKERIFLISIKFIKGSGNFGGMFVRRVNELNWSTNIGHLVFHKNISTLPKCYFKKSSNDMTDPAEVQMFSSACDQ